MPQARRKIPFSGKKKKDYLLQKRQTKEAQKYIRNHNENDDGETTEDNEYISRKLMARSQASCDPGSHIKNVNRYNLCFYQESKKNLERQKLECFKPYNSATPKQREIDASCFDGYDFPTRSEWSYNMDKETLDRNENKYFREYVAKLQDKQKTEEKGLSLFELNLETWRQLWRVLEMSDILLIVVDIRYSTLMFPPSLHNYITNDLGKKVILILNKVDLVASEVVVGWKEYFKSTYPGLPVVIFASNPAQAKKGTQQRRKLDYKRSIEGVYSIFKECKKIVGPQVDISSWEQKILEDMDVDNVCMDNDIETMVKCTDELESVKPEASDAQKYEKYYKGILTLGCIGFPNVGKSSLINALKGRKVVSVSRTPGHTKHFQTIFLTNHLRVCDCPGLVFPSSTSKSLQVLLGSFPISQLQVPYPSIQLMAEHLDLPKILKIHLPDDFHEWSSAAIADAWAVKRGFITSKSARPDRNRAANHLLRSCVVGQLQLILQFYPPDFSKDQEMWKKHAEVEEIKKYQNLPNDDDHDENEDDARNKLDNDDTSSIASTTRNAFALLEAD